MLGLQHVAFRGNTSTHSRCVTDVIPAFCRYNNAAIERAFLCMCVLGELTPRSRSAESKECIQCIHMHNVKLPPKFRCDWNFLQQWMSAVISCHTRHMACHKSCPSHQSATLKFLFYLLILSLYYGIYTMKFKLCIFYKMKRNMGCIIIIRCCSYSG